MARDQATWNEDTGVWEIYIWSAGARFVQTIAEHGDEPIGEWYPEMGNLLCCTPSELENLMVTAEEDSLPGFIEGLTKKHRKSAAAVFRQVMPLVYPSGF